MLSVEELEDILWHGTDEDTRLYCIMDGFWASGLYGRLLNSRDISWAHLFQGDVAIHNVQQAPFIIALKPHHRLTHWLLGPGYEQGWGIYFTVSTTKARRHYGTPSIHDKRFLPSNTDDVKLGNLVDGKEDILWAIRRHFRQFSDVLFEENGKIVDFRYYDPWVVYSYLTTADEKQYRHFTKIINCLFGEAHLVSRPDQVFDTALYRLDCADKKMNFLDGEREIPYHINHAQRETDNQVSPSMPLMKISLEQSKEFSVIRQEKFAYIIYEKLREQLGINFGLTILLEIKKITDYCTKYNIYDIDIMYNLAQFHMLDKSFINALPQIKKGSSDQEHGKIIKALLSERMKNL